MNGNKPVKKIKQAYIDVAIFSNGSPDKKSISLQKSYKSNGEWKRMKFTIINEQELDTIIDTLQQAKEYLTEEGDSPSSDVSLDVKKQFKIHRIIENIKIDDFVFDTHDIEEDMDNVLYAHGFREKFDEDERKVLYEELYTIALKKQLGEMTRLTHLEDVQVPLFSV